jgi:hypothetical protein
MLVGQPQQPQQQQLCSQQTRHQLYMQLIPCAPFPACLPHRWWLPLWGIRRANWWRPPIFRPGWGFPGGIRPPGKPGWRPGHRPDGWTNRVAGGAFGLAGRRPSGPLYRDPGLGLGGTGPRSGTLPRPIGGERCGLCNLKGEALLVRLGWHAEWGLYMDPGLGGGGVGPRSGTLPRPTGGERCGLCNV